MFLYLLEIVALLAFIGSWSPLSRWRLRHIPGYTGIWLLGNIPDLLKYHGTHAFYQEGHKKYGPVFKIMVCRQTNSPVIAGCANY
eukprot:jgi/Botrbrau1/14241/Bobra.0381s0004.1